MEIIKTDIMSRYEKLKPSLPEVQSVAEREKKLSKEITQGDTLAGYLVGLNGQELKIQSLISAGKTAEAKDAYDDMISTIDANRDGITAVASMRGGGTNARILVDAAQRALRSDFNDMDVKTVTGETYKLGQYFANDDLWKNPGSSYRDRMFSARAVDAMLNSEDESLRRSLRYIMQDQKYTTNKRSGDDFDQMHIQNSEEADAVIDNWKEITTTFGDGSERFVQYLHSSHIDSGAAAPMLKSFLNLAKYRAANNPGLSGGTLVSEVMGGYRYLLNSSFQGDDAAGSREREITPNKRLMADATILKMVTEMEKAGGTGFATDLRDPRVQSAFRECMAVMADATACGVDPVTIAGEQGKNVYQGFADHVIAKSSDRPSTGGFVNNWNRFSEGLKNQITGGRDFRRIATDITGDPADYLRLQRASGGVSSCPTADNMAADVYQSLKRTVGKYMTDGSDAQTAWSKVSSDPTLSTQRMDDLTKVLVSSFSGRGRVAAARRLAAEIVGTVENGGTLNIETRIRDLVADRRFRQTSPLAHESLSNWFYGNTEAVLRYGDKLAQLDLYWQTPNGGGLSERTRASAMSRLRSRIAEMSRMSEGPNRGIDPSALIDNELRRGFYFRATKDKVERLPADVNDKIEITGPDGKQYKVPLSTYLTLPGKLAEQEELASGYIPPAQLARLKAQAAARRKPDKNDSETEEE